MRVVGYGTFITRRLWKQHPTRQVCWVLGHRRVYDPRFAPFPFAIKSADSSFLGILFPATESELERLDYYEGVDSGLYYRKTCTVRLAGTNQIESAWIYLPTEKTSSRPGFPWTDTVDLWMIDVILKDPELRSLFKEFIGQP